MPKLYIETTIPSFYFNQRPEPEMVVRGNWTRKWWTNQLADFESVSSYLVVEELDDSDLGAGQDGLGDETFLGLAVGLLGGAGGALLAEDVHGTVEVAAGFDEGVLAGHQAGVGHLAELADEGGSDFSHFRYRTDVRGQWIERAGDVSVPGAFLEGQGSGGRDDGSRLRGGRGFGRVDLAGLLGLMLGLGLRDGLGRPGVGRRQDPQRSSAVAVGAQRGDQRPDAGEPDEGHDQVDPIRGVDLRPFVRKVGARARKSIPHTIFVRQPRVGVDEHVTRIFAYLVTC